MNPIEPTTRLRLGRRPAFWFRRAWLLLGLALCFVLPSSTVASSTIFGGGPFYYGGTATMNTLRASGYSTVMLWTLHVYADTAGSLIYNDQLVVANGVYVGNAGWPAQLATLKTAPTSVKRLEWSVGSWGANDFLAIKTLMDTYGTNTDSLLYRNFLALKNATGADAIDFDDETQYDVATAVKFGRMLSSIGYKVTLCPYTNPGFWQGVYNQLGTGIVDVVYLQCYAGGAGNNPATWNGYFTGLKVQPGMWCMNGSSCSSGSTAGQVQAQMVSWVGSAGITGGFMWLYDDMLSCNNGGSPADYAMAINSAVNRMTPPAVNVSSLSLTNGTFAPLATNDLILGNAGVSALSVTTSPDGTGVASVLTDGNLRSTPSSGPLGIQSGAMTYNLGSGDNGTGYNLTGIRSLTAWGDSGRINPNYSVSYSLDGVYFYPLATVNYTATSGASGTDVALGITGLTNVQSVKFDFSGGQQNGWVSYSELAVFGMSSAGKNRTPTQLVLTSSSNPSLLGTNVTFTATVQSGGVTTSDATGNLVFQVDGTAVFTNAVASGSATYANSTLALGAHTLTAVYR
ncbi:MAG: Ig-like domain-containing protein, partial [Verrucomicrobiota bacterium]